MALVRGKNTKLELVVRRYLHNAGLRYRLHDKSLPGKPDLVFRSRKIVLFVHGCFWHRHGDPNCKLARLPKTRLDFWQPKFEANRERDLRTVNVLKSHDWTVLVIWECELKSPDILRRLKNQILAAPLMAQRA